MTICILGRQPELGIAELESLYGSAAVRPVSEHCALVSETVDFSRLGGSVKAVEVLGTVPGELRAALKKTPGLISNTVRAMPDGKVKLGLSLYDYVMKPFDLTGEGLRLKTTLKKLGRSVRLVPNTEPALSSAQTYHNSLTSDLGLELVYINDGDQTIVGRVTHVQDINAYRIRDRERPKRDAFVGMLPPKLAQIIVNLAAGEQDMRPQMLDSNDKSNIQHPTSNIYILDPFCGTGVVLQEALLMGYNTYGTDLSPKMVAYTKANLEWLKTKQEGLGESITIETADATSYTWPFLRSDDLSISRSFCIATETYLGQPLGGQHPSKEKMAEIMHDTNTTITNFLRNIHPQLPAGTRLCLAVPAWFVADSPLRLPVTQELDQLGFKTHTFSHVIAPMIYHRENQITGRELLVLTKE